MTMRHLIESMESALAEVEFFEAILAADDAVLDEAFDADDVARLEALADLIGAYEDGVLSEDDDDLLEGLRSWLFKKKQQLVRKLPPGAKMVFGKIVKGGKVVGGAAKKAAAGVQKAVQKGVAAKRAVQGAAYRFTDAGQKARAAAKKVAATKGRKAGAAAWQKSQDTYKKHVKAGESHAFASSQAQAQKAKARKPKLTKPAAAPSSETMPGTGARKKGKPTQATGPAKKGAPRKRKTKMEDVFQDLDVIA
jgi:hypothetical protein